jgi:outer membrane protein assembly factor BamA
MSYNTPFDPSSNYQTGDVYTTKQTLSSTNYIQPSIAMVHDNSLQGYVGPLLGRRSRFEVAPVVGGWNFTQYTADYRRYDKIVGPLVLATRVLYNGRVGRDADRFTQFLGYPDLIRGYTSGSYDRNECANITADANSVTGCPALDQLVGTSMAVANAELRFPLLNASLGFVPIGFPPIEGAFFYDMGVAWTGNTVVKWTRPEGASPADVRRPLRSVGFSIRINALGLAIVRFDYAKPLERPGTKPFWTISLGETY